MKTGDIITPTHASFKEGEVYVVQLPEKPQFSALDLISPGFKLDAEIKKYDEAVSYSRAHPFKVHEKDKEKVKLIMWKFATDNYEKGFLRIQPKNWVPQDLTEYRIEGARFEIKEVMSPRIRLNNQTEGAIVQQVACLIEDDKHSMLNQSVSPRCHELNCGQARRNPNGRCCMVF